MAPITGLSHLVNPLATPDQLANSSSQIDGVPGDLEDSVRFEGVKLIQAASVLLRLPQELAAEAIVIFTRFWVGSEGGSLIVNNAKDVASASLYLAAKPSAHPVSPRLLLTTFEYLDKARPLHSVTSRNSVQPEDCFLSEGSYHAARKVLIKTEAQILRTLGYQTHVALPFTLCINYLQALDAFKDQHAQALARRAFAHLNTALLSPQLLYLTYQPPALATAAIYLAAKEVEVKLPGDEWWEVFDLDREELGFLVVAMMSMAGFAEEEAVKWGKRKVPLTADEVQSEVEKRRLLDAGE